MTGKKTAEDYEAELKAAKGELKTLEALELPVDDAYEELDWLNDNFANLTHEQQARILDVVTATRTATEYVTTWNTLP